MEHVYVIHYHEIALKGRNRALFLRKLQENICKATGLVKNAVRIVSGRILAFPEHESLRAQRSNLHNEIATSLHCDGTPCDDIKGVLRRVFGISSFSPAALVNARYIDIENQVITLARSRQNDTFAIAATRGDKQFALTSHELEVKLGDAVRTTLNKKVDLEHPDIALYVEVFSGGAVVYTEKIAGAGGLPVGTQPKVAALLSGGIDSPVAAYRIMKRGVSIVGVHFHSYPFTSRASIDKVKELARILSGYGGLSKLYLVPFAEAQKVIVQKTAPKYRVLLYRRLMLRIAEQIAIGGLPPNTIPATNPDVRLQNPDSSSPYCKFNAPRHSRNFSHEPPGFRDESAFGGRPVNENALGLATGESIGQVASQTIENLRVINAAVKLPVFRPLIGYDKEEIIAEAKKIGTFETSILPHDDCCTVFMPKNPATRARLQDVEGQETFFVAAQLAQDALDRALTVAF